MIDCSYSFGDAACVIQWHVLGMILPSFFTGHLVARFGALRIMSAGAGLLLCCAAVNLSGIGLWQFWAALVLLGMGWNFLYIVYRLEQPPDRKLPPGGAEQDTGRQ